MGSKCTIEYSARAAATPARALIYEGVSEQVQEGHSVEHGMKMGVMPDDSVFFAQTSDEIVGVLCFSRQSLTSVIEISLGYVEPSSRRQGVFSQLWAELHKKAVEEGYTSVVIKTHASNSAAQITAARLKFAPQVIQHCRPIG